MVELDGVRVTDLPIIPPGIHSYIQAVSPEAFAKTESPLHTGFGNIDALLIGVSTTDIITVLDEPVQPFVFETFTE